VPIEREIGLWTKDLDDSDGRVSVGSRVRIHPGTDTESRGTVVEDFGENAGAAVNVGNRVIEPARRWADIRDDATLVFLDSHEIDTEGREP
jgi:hypothetical protein